MLTETEFYDRLAEFFDVMTDWPSRLAVELPFIEATLQKHGAQTVLDSACGTGGHAIALAQRGYRVTGSDISEGMIARAKANAERAGVEIPFVSARFQELFHKFPDKFDAILCLGNSLPHVLSEASALESLLNMRVSLRTGGVLILHQLNYDKRWEEKPRWFAVNAGPLQGSETLVWRFADYDAAARTITFNIALFTKNDKGTWSVDVQSTLQQPYHRSEIEMMLHRAGFREFAFFGSLQGEAFDAASSPDLVVIAIA
jgi:glycine/sarcosine N-methyltransferase